MAEANFTPPQGVVDWMTNAQYHATSALSATGLSKLARSPRHYFDTTLNPARPIKEPSPAMKNGTLVHCALLEPEELLHRYRAKPAEIDLRTKEGKAWLYAVPPGMEVVTEESMLAGLRQANAVKELPEIKQLLSSGAAEQSAFWTDPDTGVRCKCRPDWTSPAGNGGCILVDVKTCVDASPNGFARSIAEYGYHRQAAWYSDGWALASGMTVYGFVFAVVENAWPHVAAAYMLDDDAMVRARNENSRLTALYAACLNENFWPAYASSIRPISLPAWYKETT